MAKEEHYYTQFEEGKFYHIYNRTIDKKPMFQNEGNYTFFLQKFSRYLTEVLDVYAYNLLDNHFHFLVRIKDDLTSFKEINNVSSLSSTHEIVSKQFRILFQSYALAFNKQQERLGTLFQTPFKRAFVDDNDYITHLIYYIHSNSQKHNLIDDFRNWKWSSYQSAINNKQTKLMRNEVLEWFGGEENFIKFHKDGKYLLADSFKIEE